MENFNRMNQHLLDFLPEEEQEESPPPGPSLPALPLDGAFDINSCIPQTPFYDAPFPDVGCNQEQIASFSSDQEGPASSPTNPANQPSRSLISERKRRGRMKEKLLALRSLVPNITKMDKASIIGDAVSYAQELKREEMRLTEEIAQLERVLQDDSESSSHISKQDNVIREQLESPHKTILQVVVIGTDISEFYIKIMCKSAKGVAGGLLRVLDSLEHMMISTSNLTDDGEQILLTLTVRVVECLKETNETALKLILLTNFLNQGFYILPQSSGF